MHLLLHQQPIRLLQQRACWCEWHSMQVIHNAAARLVTGARRYEYMTSVLHSLQWLPVQQWITFKTAVIMYKCLHGLAPPYLSQYCIPTSSCGVRQHLWPADTRQLIVPRTRTTYRDSGLLTLGSIVNKPAETAYPFRKRLKAFLVNPNTWYSTLVASEN